MRPARTGEAVEGRGRLAPSNLQELVVDLAHAGDPLGQVLGQPLVIAVLHGVQQRDLATGYRDLDLGRVECLSSLQMLPCIQGL